MKKKGARGNKGREGEREREGEIEWRLHRREEKELRAGFITYEKLC